MKKFYVFQCRTNTLRDQYKFGVCEDQSGRNSFVKDTSFGWGFPESPTGAGWNFESIERLLGVNLET